MSSQVTIGALSHREDYNISEQSIKNILLLVLVFKELW